MDGIVSGNSQNSDKALTGVITTSLFLTSIVGAKMGPIPLNTLALLIVLVFLLYRRGGSLGQIHLPVGDVYLSQCLVLVASSIFALFQVDRLGSMLLRRTFVETNLGMLLQVLALYMPVFLLGRGERNFSNSILKGIVYVARIQMTWGLLQYLLWEFVGFDLNQAVLVDLFGGLGKKSWTTIINLGSAGVQLRMTGLNSDGAFFGILLVMAIALDSSVVFQILYAVTVVLSMQRASLAAALVVMLFRVISSYSSSHRKQIRAQTAIVSCILCGVVVYAAVSIPAFANRVSMLVGRFATVSRDTSDNGTYRHMQYLPAAVEQVLSAGPLVALFGVGIKSSGIIFSAFGSSISNALNAHMLSSIWAIESDAAGVVAGCGLVGVIVYVQMYYAFLVSRNRRNRLLALALLTYGVMYNCSALPLVQLVYMALAIELTETNHMLDSHSVGGTCHVNASSDLVGQPHSPLC